MSIEKFLALLKLFISGNEGCHTTDAPSSWAELFQL